jgi:rhodanese-related sulfurtransferase/rubrerythrin
MRVISTAIAVVIGFGVVGCQTSMVRNVDSPVAVKAGVSEMSPAQAFPLVSAAYSQFIDVRTPEEYAAGHADRTKNIPLDTLASSFDILEKGEPVYIICRTDNRSRQAAKILIDAGFKSTIVVTGGTEAWKSAGLPMGGSPVSVDPGKLDEKTRNALISALNDERRAFATYEAVLAKFPDTRPFLNIVNAEQRHESFLLPLFAKYGVTTPKNEVDPAKIAVPASIADACKAGIEAEKANIALYDGFFAFVKEPDIREVFTRLQTASRDNHLPAFTRCSEGGGGNGRGPGPRR